MVLAYYPCIITMRPRQNGRHFANDIFKCIFLNEIIWISINISLKFVPRGPINNIPALVQIMAWRRPGDKALSEPMIVSLPTHICVTRPQWFIAVQHREGYQTLFMIAGSFLDPLYLSITSYYRKNTCVACTFDTRLHMFWFLIQILSITNNLSRLAFITIPKLLLGSKFCSLDIIAN